MGKSRKTAQQAAMTTDGLAGEVAKKKSGSGLDLLHKVFMEETNPKTVAAKLKTTDLLGLIDDAVELQEHVKRGGALLAIAKAICMEHAKKSKWKKKVTKAGCICAIGASTPTEQGTPTAFVKILKKEGRLDLADVCLSVKIGEAKKLLGTDVLEEEGFIKTGKVNKFASLSFKRKK